MKIIKLPQMIDYYRKQNNWTMKQLGQKIEKSESAVSRWIKGERSPMVDDLEKLSKIFDVPVESLMYGGSQTISSDITTIYNQLNPKRQTKVYNFASEQLEKQNKVIDVDFVKEDLSEVYVAYDVSAGVGYGNDYELTDYDIEYTNERLRNYDFAFRINGDSMEPELTTGDVALVQRTETVDNGSIYVVSYSDSLYVKEVRIEDDVFILHSLNPKYQDIPIDLVDNDEPPRIIGKVVDSFTPIQVD